MACCITLALLLGSLAPSVLTAQEVPEPQPPESVVENLAQEPPDALDEADEPPELPLPEAPEAPEAPRSRAAGDRVVIFESVTIAEDETVREVVVIGGSLTILGHVEREAVVVGGPARVEGSVGREMTVVGGTLHLAPGARIGRDVTVVGGSVEGVEHAEIGGAVNNVRLGPFFRDFDWGDMDFDFGWKPRPWFGYTFGLFWHLITLALLALLLCFVYLVAPDAVRRVEAKVETEPGKSALVGFLCALAALPALVLLVVLTCGLGLLAVPFLLLAAVVLWLVGYAAVALCLGRYLTERRGLRLASPYLVLLLGFALVEIWSFLHDLTDVPALGWISALFWLAAFVVELGALFTAFGAALLAWLSSRRRPTPPYAQPAAAGGPPTEPPPENLPPHPEPPPGSGEPPPGEPEEPGS